LNNKDNFDVGLSIYNQLSFFACKNIFLDDQSQKDISQYIYCKDFGVSPYEGTYKQHPRKWVQKYYIIKTAIAKKEKLEIEKQRNKAKKVSNG